MTIDLKTISNNFSVKIGSSYWEKLNKEHSREEIKQALSDVMKLGPMPMKELTIDEARIDFQRLKNEDLIPIEAEWSSRYPYKYAFSDFYLPSSNVGNKSSNFFQQENRWHCGSINSPSPYRTWNDEKFRKTLLNGLWTLGYKSIDNEKLRSLIGLRKYIASQFKPSVAKWIYNEYAPNGRVLDFSAGWGDRLAGFYASTARKYIGIDPNEYTFKKYYEQKTNYDFWNGAEKDIEFFNLPAEDVKFEEKFDLIFTSPPYFDIERYSKDKTQSWMKYKKKDDWMQNFLCKTIGNFWENLEIGGHLILNISDVYCHHQIQDLCDPMNDFISKLKGAKYKRAIGMQMAKRPNSKASIKGVFAEPMWIWQKEK